jgi:light-harvesting complex I chlorophyll a/b binding protein 1
LNSFIHYFKNLNNRVIKANSNLGNWLPGSDTPKYLENVVGSYGFDRLGLGSTPADLARFQEAELIHCRWAMLGSAGALCVELLGYGNWYDAPLAAEQTYFGTKMPFDLNTLVAIEFVVMAAVEARRFDETDPVKKLYPGFDIAGLVKEAKAEESMKTKEIKNGRLAMISFLGFIAQHAATGKTPLTNLSEHIADPSHVNVSSNGVSIPYL